MTHSNDILMLQLFQELHFSYGRHIETILELAHFDLLNGNSSLRVEFMALVDDGIHSLPNFLVLHPVNVQNP